MRRPPIVGMLQLPPLPGSARYRGEALGRIFDAALAAAQLLAECGFDGVQVQNMGDNPSTRRVNFETVAYMTGICREIRRNLPQLGLSVLVNWDAEASLAVGHAAGADYIRVEHTYVGASVTSWGLSQACCHEATRFRSRIGAELPIYADLIEPHATPLVQRPIEAWAQAAVFEGAADGLFITGASPDESLDLISRVRKTTKVPIWLGGGVTAGNVGRILPHVNGLTVATSIKPNHDMVNPVDRDLAYAFVEAANAVNIG